MHYNIYAQFLHITGDALTHQAALGTKTVKSVETTKIEIVIGIETGIGIAEIENAGMGTETRSEKEKGRGKEIVGTEKGKGKENCDMRGKEKGKEIEIDIGIETVGEKEKEVLDLCNATRTVNGKGIGESKEKNEIEEKEKCQLKKERQLRKKEIAGLCLLLTCPLRPQKDSCGISLRKLQAKWLTYPHYYQSSFATRLLGYVRYTPCAFVVLFCLPVLDCDFRSA